MVINNPNYKNKSKNEENKIKKENEEFKIKLKMICNLWAKMQFVIHKA